MATPIRENIRQSSNSRLWDEVQAMLAQNRIERATGVRAKHPSLLAGLVYDETGGRLTPTYAIKKGTRYRYYVSTSLLTGAGRNRSSARRIPAGDVEGLVIDRLRSFFADPGAVLDAIDETAGGSGQNQLVERGRQVAEELGAQAAERGQSDPHDAGMPCGDQLRSHRNQYLSIPPCCVPRWAIDRSDDTQCRSRSELKRRRDIRSACTPQARRTRNENACREFR